MSTALGNKESNDGYFDTIAYLCFPYLSYGPNTTRHTLKKNIKLKKVLGLYKYYQNLGLQYKLPQKNQHLDLKTY